MGTNTLYLSASRLRDQKIAQGYHGHAMPFALMLPSILGNTGHSCIRMLAAITFVVQGISVPISRGGPPVDE